MFEDANPRDTFADYAIITLGRVERLELCLEKLTGKLMDVCNPGHVPPGELKGVLDRVRMVTSVIRGFSHCVEMREALQTRENAKAEPGRFEKMKKNYSKPHGKPKNTVEKIQNEISLARLEASQIKKSLMNGSAQNIAP